MSNKATDIRVSDHAIVRYLERIEGMDIDALRRRIAGGVGLGDIADVVGQAVVPVEAWRVVIYNDCVITVLGPRRKRKRKRKKRKRSERESPSSEEGP